jgi:hypothetical protein
MNIVKTVTLASRFHESLEMTMRGRPIDLADNWLDARLVLRTSQLEATVEHAAFRVEDWQTFGEQLRSMLAGTKPAAATDFLEPWLELGLSRDGDRVDARGVLSPSTAGVARVEFHFEMAAEGLADLLSQVEDLLGALRPQ